MTRIPPDLEHVATVPYWLSDPGHAWLVVERVDVERYGLAISEFSYVSPDESLLYLEEDRDAALYVTAAGIGASTWSSWPEVSVPSAECRSFPRYTPVEPT